MSDREFKYPGIPTTSDGSDCVVWVETRACQGAAAYPITPSTNMGVGFQAAVADGQRNVWDEELAFVEPESEHSSASACEGFALAGGRVTNFTSGQGLLLMKEVLYTIAGKRLPVVFHIGARAMTVHALNVHAGHDDVMGVIDCGWGMLFARNNQEIADFALISRRAAEDSFNPFLNIQDGFLSTHTVETVRLPEPDLIKEYLGHPSEKLINLMDPKNPIMSGTVQNQDAYMRGKLGQRAFYAPLKNNLKKAMAEYGELTGRKYDLIEKYYMEDAEYAVVGMGTFMETAKATVKHLRETQGVKVGVVTVFSFRPFPGPELVEALRNCKVVSVLERCDEICSPENPLAGDIKAAFADAMWGHPDYEKTTRVPMIQHGAGGLGSRDVRSNDFIAIVNNMIAGEKGKIRYCVGIDHEDALSFGGAEPDVRPKGAFSMRGHSIGGYGSVTTNKVIATVCGSLFGLDVQAYPKYGAEKKGLPTTFYLTVAPGHIDIHQELSKVEFVPVFDTNAFLGGNPLKGLVPGGVLFLHTEESVPLKIWKSLPSWARKEIKERNIKVYGLDTVKVAREVASKPDLVQRMQGIVLLGVFLKATPYAAEKGMNEEVLMAGVEKGLKKYFGKRGEQVVKDNMTCVVRGYKEVVEIPAEIMAQE